MWNRASMSILSSQRNRLLFLANELETRYFNMDEYSNAMRRAADTIWELRNKLAGTVDQSERITELEDENAKLRELCEDFARLPVVPSFDCYGCKYDKWVDCRDGECKLLKRANEMGIDIEND